MDIVKSVEHEQLKNKIPDLKVGDTVKVYQKIKEGNRERIQVFEGIIIKRIFHSKKNFLWCRCRKNILSAFTISRKS